MLSGVLTAHADPARSMGAVPGGSRWHAVAGHRHEWTRGCCAPSWGPYRHYGGSGAYLGPGVATYWVWGPSGGAFDYPFADWREPHGGWGNP